MQIDKQIRRVLTNRKHALKRTIFRRIVLIIVTLFLFCQINPPGALSFFIKKQELQSTLTVTTELKYITASLVFEDNQERIPGFNKTEYLNVQLKFGQAYDAENVDVRSLAAYSEGKNLPFDNISYIEERLLLSFDHEFIKSLLGHGSHTVTIEGMFKDGWIKFLANGTLVIIDENVLAEQEAIKLVESLEADSTTWYQAKIDAARKVVEGLREGAVKDDLLRRMQNIEERLARIIKKMNERKLFEKAENALSVAEETRTKDDYEAAVDLIAKLPEGEQKEALEKKLESIEIIDDENNGKQSVSEDVYKSADDVSDIQDKTNELMQEPEPVVFMHKDNSDKVSD